MACMAECRAHIGVRESTGGVSAADDRCDTTPLHGRDRGQRRGDRTGVDLAARFATCSCHGVVGTLGKSGAARAAGSSRAAAAVAVRPHQPLRRRALHHIRSTRSSRRRRSDRRQPARAARRDTGCGKQCGRRTSPGEADAEAIPDSRHNDQAGAGRSCARRLDEVMTLPSRQVVCVAGCGRGRVRRLGREASAAIVRSWRGRYRTGDARAVRPTLDSQSGERRGTTTDDGALGPIGSLHP